MRLVAVILSAFALVAVGCVASVPAAGAHGCHTAKKCKKAHDGTKERYCPATIYEVADGTLPADSRVRLSGALSAVAASGETAWLGTRPSDPGYSGPGYSGLEIDLAGLSPLPAMAVGDHVSVYGTVVVAPTGNRLAAAGLSAKASEGAFPPFEISAATFVTPGEAGPLDAVLVRVPSQSIVSQTPSEWTLSGGFALGDDAIGELPNGTFPDSTQFEAVTGIADTLGSAPRLLPRDIGDLLLSS